MYLGRLDDNKRVDTLIKALKLINNEYTLEIVGNGYLKESLIELSNNLKLSSRIKFHGYVSEKKVKNLFNSSDLFVLASEFEGQPTVIIEAIRNGLNILSSNIPGSRFILDELNLLNNTFKTGDYISLAKKINELNYDETTSLTQDLLKKKFSWEERSIEIQDIYDSLISK